MLLSFGLRLTIFLHRKVLLILIIYKHHVDVRKMQCQELSEEKTQKLTPGHGKSDFIATEAFCVEDQSSTADGLSLLRTVFIKDLLVNSKSN